MTQRSDKEVQNTAKLLALLKEHRVKEYKTPELHIVLDTSVQIDPNKLYNFVNQEEKNPYGPTL